MKAILLLVLSALTLQEKSSIKLVRQTFSQATDYIFRTFRIDSFSSGNNILEHIVPSSGKLTISGTNFEITSSGSLSCDYKLDDSINMKTQNCNYIPGETQSATSKALLNLKQDYSNSNNQSYFMPYDFAGVSFLVFANYN